MTMCFDCKFRNIYETSHEWIECECKVDGKMHNPYRPKTFSSIDCENWRRIGEENVGEKNTERTV